MKVELVLRKVFDGTAIDRWGGTFQVVSKLETAVAISAVILHRYPDCGQPERYEVEGIGETFDEAKADFDKNLAIMFDKHKTYNDNKPNKYSFEIEWLYE